ncbi:MAG: archaeosortase/exosortase family protein [Bacteroidota bacterium]
MPRRCWTPKEVEKLGAVAPDFFLFLAMRTILGNPLLRFLLTAFLLYITWYLVYELWIHPARWLDDTVIRSLEWMTSGLLVALGFELIPDSIDQSIRTVGIDGTNGLWIGDNCDGIILFVLFTVFVVAYPGAIKRKLWFIPLGLLTIHLLNVLRILALTLIIYYFPDPEVLDFNHTYTFQAIVYAYVFFLWYLWANKLSGKGGLNPPEAAAGDA